MQLAVYILGIYSIAATVIMWDFWRINRRLEQELTDEIDEHIRTLNCRKNNSVE